eukprot:1105662-Ditylum_brightwellii.AAC.1
MKGQISIWWKVAQEIFKSALPNYRGKFGMRGMGIYIQRWQSLTLPLWINKSRKHSHFSVQ